MEKEHEILARFADGMFDGARSLTLICFECGRRVEKIAHVTLDVNGIRRGKWACEKCEDGVVAEYQAMLKKQEGGDA